MLHVLALDEAGGVIRAIQLAELAPIAAQVAAGSVLAAQLALVGLAARDVALTAMAHQVAVMIVGYRERATRAGQAARVTVMEPIAGQGASAAGEAGGAGGGTVHRAALAGLARLAGHGARACGAAVVAVPVALHVALDTSVVAGRFVPTVRGDFLTAGILLAVLGEIVWKHTAVRDRVADVPRKTAPGIVACLPPGVEGATQGAHAGKTSSRERRCQVEKQ